MIAISNPKSVDYKEDKYLRYFPGGREGIQKRFGDAFREKMQGHLDELVQFFEERREGRFNVEVLREISRGNYTGLDSKVVYKLINLFLIDASYGFGVPVLTYKDKIKLKQKMKADGFTPIGGTVIEDGQLKHSPPNAISSDGLLNLYLIVRALDEL